MFEHGADLYSLLLLQFHQNFLHQDEGTDRRSAGPVSQELSLPAVCSRPQFLCVSKSALLLTGSDVAFQKETMHILYVLHNKVHLNAL